MRRLWNGDRRLRGALLTLGVSLSLTLLAGVATAESVDGADGSAEGSTVGDGVNPALATRAAGKSAAVVAETLTLPALDVAALRAQDDARTDDPEWKSYNRAGVVRRIERFRAPRHPHRSRRMTRMPDGSLVWRKEIHAEGATSLRLRIGRCEIPEGAEIVVYDADEPSEIYGPLRPPAGGGDFYTPSVFGDRVVLQVTFPAGHRARNLRLEVDAVAQCYRELDGFMQSHDHEEGHDDDERAGRGAFRMGLGCMNNVASDASYFADVSRAAALFEFTQGGDVFLCSGTLLNDADETTTIPYFLTANHCVSTDGVARSMEIFWDFKASTANGSPPSLQSVPRTNGATLVATSRNFDSSLVRITGTLPANRFFAGWTSDVQSVGTQVVGVHHPEGSHMRISYGRLGNADDEMHEVLWSNGVTAQGSSGSALFNAAKQVIGQLCCGGSSCNRRNEPDFYGRFDKSFSLFDDHLGAAADGGGGNPDPGPVEPPGPTPPPTADLPTPVQRLRARVKRRSGRVTLRWKDKARGEDGYRVEILAGESWSRVGDLRRNSRKFRDLPGGGTHVYRVGPYNGDGTAWTEISVTVPGGGGASGDSSDPQDNLASGATDLGSAGSGSTSTHTLSRSDRRDWFKLDLTGGETYFIRSTGQGDTVGAVFDQGGARLLDGNDDDPDGSDFNFGISFTAPATGTYWIEVTAFRPSTDTAYQLVWSRR